MFTHVAPVTRDLGIGNQRSRPAFRASSTNFASMVASAAS